MKRLSLPTKFDNCNLKPDCTLHFKGKKLEKNSSKKLQHVVDTINQGMFWNLCFHVDNRIPSIFIKNWYIILIKMPELCNICLKTNQLICAEGLFWELRYQHENKGFKTYLGTYFEKGVGKTSLSCSILQKN